jgi:putative transposase
MAIISNQFYHVYNQGNNRRQLFPDRSNKLFFLKKYRELVAPYAETVAWCLMNNHFHFLLYTNEISVKEINLGHARLQTLSNGFRILQSSYSQAFNKMYNQSGSVFRPKVKMKDLDGDPNYPLICFHYIHQNPFTAGLVSRMEDWEFSSFKDYLGARSGSLCNHQIAEKYIGINRNTFYQESYNIIPELRATLIK